MFDFFLKLRQNKPVNNQPKEEIKPSVEPQAIAAPKKETKAAFTPIDAVIASQGISGKFNYNSSTWKYLDNYFKARLTSLHRRNENATLSMEKTQLLRGQLKEIKLLINHINQLAGIKHPPEKTSLGIIPTDWENQK